MLIVYTVLLYNYRLQTAVEQSEACRKFFSNVLLFLTLT